MNHRINLMNNRFCSQFFLGLVFTISCTLDVAALDQLSVDTPHGKFECINNKSTNYEQLLKLNGKTIFREIKQPDGIREGVTLSSGIVDQNFGCPTMVLNKEGYLIIVRDIQPPHFGVQGYAVINFNKVEPVITLLGEGLRPRDDKITHKERIKWSDNGFILNFYGYLLDQSATSSMAAKPRQHIVKFDFADQKIEILN